MKRWTWVLGGVVAAGAAFAAILWDAHRAATAAFERHAKGLEARIEELRSAPFPGRFLPGEGAPGNGWSAFARAVEAVGNPAIRDKRLIMGMDRDRGFDAAADRVDAFLARQAGDLDALRAALRAERLDPGYAYEEGRVFFDAINSTAASRAIFGSALHLHERGGDREALDLLLLHFAKGLALEAGGGRAQLSHRIWSETEGAFYWRKILSNHALSAKDLADVAAELDRLEARRPDPRHAFRVADVVDRERLLRWEREGDDPMIWEYPGTSRGRSWRYFWSRRLARAAALNEVERYFRDLDTFRPGNPYIDVSLTPIDGLLEIHAEARRVWTSMRIATARAWYEVEMGTLPAALDALVPRHLPALPEGAAAEDVWPVRRR